MTNAYYNRSLNPLPTQRVGSSDLKSEFQSLEIAFDQVEIDVETANDGAASATASAAAAADESAAAIAAANYKGPWASLSGALATPASVSHGANPDVYMLLESVADVTAHVPGVSTKWKNLSSAFQAGDVLTTARTLAAPDWLKCDGAQYLRASYPAVEGLLPSPPADGTTWAQRTLPTSASWQSVTYGNGVFVAVAYGSSIAATSPDGVTWTQQTLPVSANWRAIAYGNGLFVVLAASSGFSVTSPDGVTWTQRTISGNQWLSVAYGNGVFVAIANNSNAAMTSPDGINWTAQTLPISTFWTGMAFGNGTFVAVNQSNATAITSSDGVTWAQQTLPTVGPWWSIAFGNGIFVANTVSTTVSASSPDGITWVLRVLPLAASWQRVAAGNNVFAAIVASSTIAATLSINTRTTTTVNTLLKPAYPVVGSNMASVTVTAQTE